MTTHGQRISALEDGQSVVLAKVPTGGSLEARRLTSGVVQFYWRHTQESRTTRVPIGIYDSGAPPKSLKSTARGYSIAAAFEHARELAKVNAETPGGVRAERERQAAARSAAQDAQLALSKFTLHALCNDYVDWLKKQGKLSYVDARGIFLNHLFNAFPATAEKPASAVGKREIVTVLRRLTESEKKTTARKLRSYLRAAYSCAVKADSDASLPSSFIGYNVTTNPVEATVAIQGRSDKNPLSTGDLRDYWKALQDEPGVIGAALRLHALSGGQRTAQLVRLTQADVTRETMRLLDGKGKRGQPREHFLPITRRLEIELQQLSGSGFLLSTDAGKTPMHPTSMSTWAAAVAERAEIKEFQLKRVRSGIETMLAGAGIPLHIRGQLQSHGIGGVQEKHYDAHHYLPEKRRALDVLSDLLEARTASSLRPLRRRAA